MAETEAVLEDNRKLLLLVEIFLFGDGVVRIRQSSSWRRPGSEPFAFAHPGKAGKCFGKLPLGGDGGVLDNGY